MNNGIDLFINIGNTNTTFGFIRDNDIKTLVIKKYKTNLIWKNKKYRSLFKVQFDSVYIASVVNKYSKIINGFLKAKGVDFSFIDYKKNKLFNLDNLEDKNELGQDILAQLYFISNHYEKATMISLGTANVIYQFKDKQLQGCIIYPGIHSSLNFLHQTTDIKNAILNKTNKDLGLNTNEAISIGLINSVELFVNGLNKKDKLPIIYSGGNAKYFIDKKNWVHIENIEILGLYYFSQLNK